jgi:LmbE family N-acetylglucosaminyl deacetylase
MAAKDRFEFVRLVGSERRVGPTLASVSRSWRRERECFLFISPHDDDVAIGGGLTILSAVREKVPVHVAVVTDGAMGYCSEAEKDRISAIRRDEAYAAYTALGVPRKHLHWLGFPDCRLADCQGRRPAERGTPSESHGFTGLQNAFTKLLRTVRPNQVFLPTATDLHPDHRIVHSEMLISCFHATGDIWPELGEPLPAVPYLHELAVYCSFPTAPKLRLKAPRTAFQKKLRAIAHFKSQKQIRSVVELVRRGGPLEYLRPLEFSLYNPSIYRDLFEEPPMVPMFR